MQNPQFVPLHARLGAACTENACSFLVWAPKARRVQVHVTSPAELLVDLTPAHSGYFQGAIEGIGAGARYKYRLDGANEFPDPASRYQPEGVHGPSEAVGAEFPWTDRGWRGHALSDYIIYELHIGTFTPEGTFDAAIDRLGYLKELGITAIEVMPVGQFPGSRNWGYDGAFIFAAQNSYGGPAGLKRLVNAAHEMGIAVILDVVYNHIGPEGNYLDRFGHYFTTRYQTPWGQAVNFDGADSAPVRRFVIENALQWTTEFHIDGLRLDAIHAIFDRSELHILRETAEAVHKAAGQRAVYLIAESDLNDVRIITPPDRGGYGLDAQWSDDFHHSLHALLTGERTGYYQDYGELRHLAKAFEDGFVYSGQHSAYRGRLHGTPSRQIPTERFVVSSQNHDQVGNRMLGERLNQLIVREELMLAAAALALSPFVPMLFMGQEYAESAPFLYFVSHSDPALIAAVRQGRQAEFAAFAWRGEQPDAQAESTFLRSKLDHALRDQREHRAMYEFYRELLRLRKHIPSLRRLDRSSCAVLCLEREAAIIVRRWSDEEETLTILHFGEHETTFELTLAAGAWTKELDSCDQRWLGPGSPLPGRLISDGNVAVRMAGKCAALFQRRNGG